jgi:ABC-type phosphonate transport system ATPase subunit
MKPTVLNVAGPEGEPVSLSWSSDRVFRFQGRTGSGKTTALRQAVADFEAQGGEALVHVESAWHGYLFPTKLFTFSAARDTVPCIEELTTVRLDGETQTPLLFAMEDVTRHDQDVTLTTRLLQVARHAEALNAWVIVTGHDFAVGSHAADELADFAPREYQFQNFPKSQWYAYDRGYRVGSQ